MVFLLPLKRLLPYWLVCLALLLFLSGCTGFNTSNNPDPTPTANPGSGDDPYTPHFIDTWNNIHSFLTFDYNISNPATVAKRYDFVWGASVDTVGAFRSGNPDIFLTYYIPFHRDNGTFSNSQAYHDLNYWQTTHPDWILYKCDRVTPAYEFGNPNIPLDFANPAVVSWQVQTYGKPASRNGYDGIAADNVILQNVSGACGVYVNGQWVQRYSGHFYDPKWAADVITWLTLMQQGLHHLQHPLALIPNLSLDDLLPLSNPQIQQVVAHVDGVLNEEGFTRSAGGYLTGSYWVQVIQFIEDVQRQHKAFYSLNEFPLVDHAGIQWALASYLMSKEHGEALYISKAQQYGGDFWYSEYNIQIGNPVASMYQTQGVYEREYTHGLSIVNPSATNSYTITLDTGKHYLDLYGNSVGQTITMSPHSGIVLLTSS